MTHHADPCPEAVRILLAARIPPPYGWRYEVEIPSLGWCILSPSTDVVNGHVNPNYKYRLVKKRPAFDQSDYYEKWR